MIDDLYAEPKRSEIRVIQTFTVFMERHLVMEESINSSIVVTKSIDVSANGVKIILDSPLPMQSLVRLCLESNNGEAPFLLIGEVAWIFLVEKQTMVGFHLVESIDTDITRWKEFIAHCLFSEV